jgi:hypothetical protein
VRAPTSLSPLLTDEQWLPIKQSLAAVGVDADTVTYRIGPSRHDPAGSDNPLREILPTIAQTCELAVCAQQRMVTPKRLAETQRKILEQAEELLSLLNDQYSGEFRASAAIRNYLRNRSMVPRTAGPADTLRAALETFIAKLATDRQAALAKGSSHGKLNATAHRLYWGECMSVWRGNVRPNLKDKYAERFLRACSTPFFPNQTTTGAVASFVKYANSTAGSDKPPLQTLFPGPRFR